MKKTPHIESVDALFVKNLNKCDSLSTAVKVIISFVPACVRASFVRSFLPSFLHSFIHSLRYSMSVNYVKILLDKFMVLTISMSPGIIGRCVIILSADRQQTQ